MNKTVVSLFILFNIACTLAGPALRNTKAAAKADVKVSLFQALEQIESHEFGKKIIDTIALQLKNKSPLSDIA
jgi:hypothetical protein